MSYATSLLMAYPPPYGPSTLLSDDLVQRSSFPTYYEPPAYRSNSRLRSDNFIYSANTFAPMTYRSLNNIHFPTITDWQQDIPAYPSMNNVREYSDSIGTASNTTTASSMAQPVEDSVFPNYQPGYNPFLTELDPTPTRTKLSARDDQPITTTFRSLPDMSTTHPHSKISPFEGMEKQATPVPSLSASRKGENHFPREATLLDIERPPLSVDNQIRLHESKKDSASDQNHTTEETAWIDKIDQLHTAQAQREKERIKASRALPTVPKKPEHKPSPTHDNRYRAPSYEHRNETYFDSIFDGNFYRKNSTNQQRFVTTYQQKFNTPSPNKPKTIVLPRYNKPTKAPQYEPPSINRPRPSITTSSWRKQGENPSGAQTARENVPKDSGERYREALQKFRTDRAEQQQREQTESTAKRLNYGDYVRRSTREGSLLTLFKPSPWSDFIDMKKGNLYAIEEQEKKDLYNQSRSYGERVRNRNFALHQAGSETARSHRYALRPPMENEETQSGDETSKEDHHDSKSLKRSNSTSTVKTYTKNPHRRRKSTDRSSSSNNSSEDEVTSDVESRRKLKKRIYDTSNRTTEDSDRDETTDQRSTRTKNYDDSDDDLFTVREEKTLESLENKRGKKR